MSLPTLVSSRPLWLNDPLEETSFLEPTVPLPPCSPMYICTLWGSFSLYFYRDDLYYHEIDINQSKCVELLGFDDFFQCQ